MTSKAMERYPQVFKPFRIGDVEVRNRIFIPAHTTNFAENFLPTKRHVAYHRARAAGGVGLIFVEPLRVHRTALGRAGGLAGADPAALPGLRAIVEAIHEGGSRAFVQITHTGRHSDNFVDRLPPWAPSSIPWTTSGEIPHAMTHREMKIVLDGYVATARFAADVGFEGMEVHFGHGHLLHQYLSPICNARSDEYGGSIENRLRYPLEVLRAVLAEVGHKVPVGIRVSVDELMQGGLDEEASREIIGIAARVPGVAFVNASVSAYNWPSIGYHVADMSYPPHLFMRQSAGLRSAIGGLPLLAANRYTSLKDAEEGLSAGIDMIGMNRAHMADPDIIRKTMAGEEDTIRPCVSSNFCIGQIAFHRPIACMMNPRVGREETWDETPAPAERKKKLLIVGGGPAGMETAYVAASRGHDVTLWEKSAALGGALNLGGTGVGRHDLHKMRDYLERRLRGSAVTIELGKTGTFDAIRAAGAECVIVATGAENDAKGMMEGLATIEEAMARGKEVWEKAGPSSRIGIFDTSGSWATLSAAETLAAWGADVSIFGSPDSPFWDVNIYSRMIAQDRLRERGVRLYAGIEVLRIDQGSVTLRNRLSAEETTRSGFTEFLRASRGKSNLDLPEALERAGIETYAIGDALAPHSLLEAMFDGHALARRL